MAYHNTTNLKGNDLSVAKEKELNQTEIIFMFFKDNPKMAFTPAEVMSELEEVGYDYPLTSVRRAITDLTKIGKLKQLEIVRLGIYGRVNFCWTLADVGRS
ncbi:MAG: hypothetical protein ACO1G5_03190 [Bacteroidota bacterium]